jgi:membrane dipeptidase
MHRKVTFPFLIILTALFPACKPSNDATSMTDDELRSYATELAMKFTIVDGHIDLPDLLREKKFQVGIHSSDTLISTGKGEFDYTRAVKGGLDAPFMSIYIPIEYQDKSDHGAALADSLINTVIGITQQLPDKFALANAPNDIEANTKAGKISLPMGMENGAPIGNDITKLKYFFDRGIRYITLTHNKDNQICDASRDTTHTWNGLSPFGEEVVAEMNRLGIMVDISHVDDSTFYAVMKLTKVPVIASHSSCRAFAPTVMRDMTDDMIRELGKNNGVIMINYYTAFLDSAVVNTNMKLDQFLKARNLKSTDSVAKGVIAAFRRAHPAPTNVETVANHIDHVVNLVGVDHVGIGSDFDGVDGNLPAGLEDVSTYPNLIFALLKRGYSEEDIGKICSGNILRVWRDVIESSEKAD